MTVLPGWVQRLIMLQHGLVGQKTRPVALIKAKQMNMRVYSSEVVFYFFPPHTAINLLAPFGVNIIKGRILRLLSVYQSDC